MHYSEACLQHRGLLLSVNSVRRCISIQIYSNFCCVFPTEKKFSWPYPFLKVIIFLLPHFKNVRKEGKTFHFYQGIIFNYLEQKRVHACASVFKSITLKVIRKLCLWLSSSKTKVYKRPEHAQLKKKKTVLWDIHLRLCCINFGLLLSLPVAALGK